MTHKLSIIIAVKDAASNLDEICARLDASASSGVQVIFVFAGPSPDVWRAPSGCTVLTSPEQSLTPHLWRDGIEFAGGETVALTTAHCIPASGWVDALKAADLLNNAGVGGVIDVDARCSPMHKAIHLLRYLAFAPPQRARALTEIAADNAIYRRDEILAHADLLAEGFWEPSFHRRFARDGLQLTLDPHILVSYRGRESASAFAMQRYQHGQEYGASRAGRARLPTRMAYLLASPLLPAVILARIFVRALQQSRFALSLPLAMPWLLWFVIAWSLGEARGYWSGVFSPAGERIVDE